MKTLRFTSVSPTVPTVRSPSRRTLASAWVVAGVLAVTGCTTMEDAWDGVFGDGPAAVATDEAATEPTAEAAADTRPEAVGEAAAPMAEGLRASPRSGRYDEEIGRRDPIDRHALVDEPPAVAQAAAPPAPRPAVAPVEREAPDDDAGMAMAAAPTPPATPAETMRPMPLAASPPPPAPVTAVSGGSGMLVADQGMPVGRAMTVDDLGTTVIGGDGAVSVEPYVPVAAASAADASAGDAYAPIGAGVSTLVATIQFAHGSAGLSANDRKILRQVADLQKRYGGTLRVVGHASSRTANMTLAEHQMANFSTSAARADQVTSALARLGTPAQAIQAVALSDNDPVYYEVMPSGEAGNRRAEIYLDY